MRAVHGHHSWETGTQEMHDPWRGHGSTVQNRGARCKLEGCQYSKETGKEHIHRSSSPCSIGQAQSSASEELASYHAIASGCGTCMLCRPEMAPMSIEPHAKACGGMMECL